MKKNIKIISILVIINILIITIANLFIYNTNAANQNTSNSSNNSLTNSNSNNSVSNNKNTGKSSNANLANLGIKPNDFKGFSASKTSYDVTVPNDTDKVTVYATAQDKKAKIKGNETQKLKVGKNSLDVTVTAEDGTTKTYTINVTREENEKNSKNTTESTISDQEAQTTENSDLKKLTIKDFNLSPAFSPYVYEYKVDVTKDISNLDIDAEGANNNVSIDIVGNENLIDGENTITLLVYNEETKQNSTYQIIVNKKSENNEEVNDNFNDAIKKANTIRGILIGIAVFMIICMIIVIIVKRKQNKNENEMYEYDEDDIERLNLNGENEFFNRVNNEKKDEIFANMSINFNNEVNNNEKNEYDTEDYLKTDKTKRKGKHF